MYVAIVEYMPSVQHWEKSLHRRRKPYIDNFTVHFIRHMANNNLLNKSKQLKPNNSYLMRCIKTKRCSLLPSFDFIYRQSIFSIRMHLAHFPCSSPSNLACCIYMIIFNFQMCKMFGVRTFRCLYYSYQDHPTLTSIFRISFVIPLCAPRTYLHSYSIQHTAHTRA